MNKKVLSLIVLSLVIIPLSISAATITNPINASNFTELLSDIATGIGKFIAVLGTIMLIISGIMYLTSAGSPERINSAKKAFIFSVVGIAIGVAASSIAEIVVCVLDGGTSC